MKSVFLRRQAIGIALLAVLFGAVLPGAHAQRSGRDTTAKRDAFLKSLQSLQGNPRGAVPGRQFPMVGDTTFLPKDVPVRSLKGVKGFDKAASRVRIGGVNGANVVEKVVNITRTPEPIDERTPFWTSDERFLYFASNTTGNARYGLFRIDASPPAGVENLGPNPSTAITNPADTTFDYLFPAINNGGTRIAFIRSSDGLAIDSPVKRWNLFVATLPGTGAFIDTTTLGPTDLRSLTDTRTVPNGAGAFVPFTNVGRPSWIGSTDLVFSAQIQGDPNYHLFQVNIQTGKIFQLTTGGADERNPQVSPNGRLIAFDSDAAPVATGAASTYVVTTTTRPRTDTDPVAQPASAPAKNPSGKRNIFVTEIIPRTEIRQITNRYAGAPDVDNSQPAWSSLQNNQFTNPNGFTLYVAFSTSRIPQFAAGDATQTGSVTRFVEGPSTSRSLYYVVIDRQTGGSNISSVLTENAPTVFDTNSPTASEGARRIDTVNDTLINGNLNDLTRPRFSDQYPAFAPFITSFRVAFQSNRNGDLRLNSFPASGSGFTRSSANNIFIASLIDITAPTLIRWDTSTPTGQVVHINLIQDENNPYNATRTDRTRADGIIPGSRVFFTVRVDDREAGMRPTNSADGGAAYIQIKNPNSRYQSRFQGGNGVEHKEYFGNILLFEENNVPLNYINFGGTFDNPGHEYEAQPISAADRRTYVGHASQVFRLLFQNQIPGFDFEFGSARLPSNNSIARPDGSTGPINLVSYIAGIDDQSAFSGTTLPPLDGVTRRIPDPRSNDKTTLINNPNTLSDGSTPNIWLKLEPVVQRNADGSPVLDANGNPVPVRPRPEEGGDTGGVLYGAAWTVPDEASDWYLDVVLYDNAVNPFDTRFRSNVIIYDNVWGFSSAPPIAGLPSDVLVVADYPLGQKFFSSRFGELPNAQNLFGGGTNLQPIFYGVESYYTDRDLSDFPPEREDGGAPPAPGGTTARVWSRGETFLVSPQVPFGANGGLLTSGYPNGLGVEGYNDEYLDPEAITIEGANLGGAYRLTQPNRYSIWRVLSRGRVPNTLLNDYLPQRTTAPADLPSGESRTSTRTITNANRMVVWMSPFAGNNFVGEGTITELNTQNDLSAYVSAGGRLFISGADIAFALVGNGQSNNFFSNVLKAQYVRDSIVVPGLTAADVNVAGNYVEQLRRDPWDPAAAARHAYGAFEPPPHPYRPLDETAPGNPFIRTSYGIAGADFIFDGSPVSAPTSAYVDVVRANPSTTPAGLAANTPPDSVDVFLYNGSAPPPAYGAPGAAPAAGSQQSAFIASSLPVGTSPVGIDPVYNAAQAAIPVGKVMYGAMGFESISQGWYTYTLGQLTYIATLGRRTQVMHNVTCSFRTGTLFGRVIDNDGSPVAGALVRAVRNAANDAQVASGTGLTDANGNFQIVGLQPGFYVTFGYQAGYYTQHNTGNTVHGASRTATTFQLKKASPGALGGIPTTNATTGTRSSGGVFDASGARLPANEYDSIRVVARRLEPDGRYTEASADVSTVGEPGTYSFNNLAVVDPRFGYVVIANPRDRVDPATGNIVSTVGPDGKNPLTFVDATGRERAYFNPKYDTVRVTSPTQPTIRLGAGTTIQDNGTNPIGPTVVIREGVVSLIDFLLPAAPGRISGRVLNAVTREGIAGVIVTATPVTGGAPIAQGVTDANGNYTLTLINPPAGTTDAGLIPGGTYQIGVSANGYQIPANLPIVSVVSEPVVVPDILLQPLPPGSLSGLVRRFNGQTATASGVGGATVTFYAVSIVNGVETRSDTPAFTATVSETPTTTPDGYTFNYRVENVPPGTYIAFVSRPGLAGTPSPFAGIVVTTGQETRNINFSLEPPKIYGEGIQLISLPQDYSAIPTPSIFGFSATGDNDGNGVINATDQSIFTRFNVAEWTGTQYNIGPDIRLQLGKGYFVRFATVASIQTLGRPSTADTFPISLTAGWNLIGHPFTNRNNASEPAADIDLSDPNRATYSYTSLAGELRTNVALSQAVADGAVQAVAYSYTGSNAGSQYVQTTLVQPYLGYWFRAFVPVQMTLRYPGAATRATRASKENNGKFMTVTRQQRETVAQRSVKSVNATNWRLQIAAMQGELKDSDNTIGIAPTAKDGFDTKNDNEKPPMVQEAKSLYVALQGTDTAGRSVDMSDNIKAPGGTKTWNVTVETTGDGDVTLYWPNVNRLPRGIAPVLVDETTGKRVDMRGGGGTFTFSPSGRAKRSFRVEVAPPASAPLDILNLHTVTGATRGGSYQFRFTPTRSVDVTTRIVTLSGRTVRRLQSRATAGTEAGITWDGRDELGGFVPAGPYQLDITVRDERGQVRTAKRMVMINR